MIDQPVLTQELRPTQGGHDRALPRVQWTTRNPLSGSRERPAQLPIPIYDAATMRIAGYLP